VVVPLLKDGAVVGVLDLDCPLVGGFTEEDAEALEEAARMLVEASDVSVLEKVIGEEAVGKH
jgi:putative methionine-R-sulfoxide reductase with GAF domain